MLTRKARERWNVIFQGTFGRIDSISPKRAKCAKSAKSYFWKNFICAKRLLLKEHWKFFLHIPRHCIKGHISQFRLVWDWATTRLKFCSARWKILLLNNTQTRNCSKKISLKITWSRNRSARNMSYSVCLVFARKLEHSKGYNWKSLYFVLRIHYFNNLEMNFKNIMKFFTF